jgi:hypothetical protein
MAKAKVRFRIARQICKLSERETARLLDYCHRLGVDAVAARLDHADPEPDELTRLEARRRRLRRHPPRPEQVWRTKLNIPVPIVGLFFPWVGATGAATRSSLAPG